MPRPLAIFVSVAVGFVAFVVAWVLGSALTATTGIPLIGGLLNGVLTAMVLTAGLVGTRFFGSATLMWIVFALCASPTTTLGPPGIYKVAIGAIAGFIWDIVYALTGRSRLGLYLGAMIGSASIMGTLILALTWGFGEGAAEALERYQRALVFIIVINMVVTLIGVYLGNLVYHRRLAKLPPFRTTITTNAP